MKNTLFNLVAVLLCITLIASAGVGVVNMITLEPIARAKEAAVSQALKKVLPAFKNNTAERMTIDNLPITVYTATGADGSVVGYAVQTATKKGFSGLIRMVVGFTPDGEIINVNVLEQSETPGLGTKMEEEGNPLLMSVRGKNPEAMQLVDGKLAVRKDGGDVDALTAATISSRAYCDAINRAWMAYHSVLTGEPPHDDAASGASLQKSKSGKHSEGTKSDASQEGEKPGKSHKDQKAAKPGKSHKDKKSHKSHKDIAYAVSQTKEPAARKGGHHE